MTNAFNLLDNMDGLAATLAAIACAFFAIDAYTVHPSHLVAVLALGICFACIGFLPYNLRLRRPAAVFMGDSGGQVLGFAARRRSGSPRAGPSPARPSRRSCCRCSSSRCRSSTRRSSRSCACSRGARSREGGRDHTSHRLVYQGLSDKRAVVLLGVVSAALGLTSLALQGARRHAHHARRRADHLRVPAAVRQLPRRHQPRAASSPTHVVPPLALRAPAPPRRGASSTSR